MRTTRKVNDEELKEAKEIGEPFVREYQEGDYCELEGTYDRDRLNKLGQLEDIEEELGIDLYKLISTQCFYRFKFDENMKETFVREELKNWFIDISNKRLVQIRYAHKHFRSNAHIIYDNYECVYFRDYGNKGLQTDWALTREELL